MNNKSLFLFFIILLIIFTTQIIYLSTKKEDIAQKIQFVKTIGLPDLAISTEAKYIRHRSLSSIGDIFNENPESIEYFPSTFIYAPSTTILQKGYR